MKNIVRISFKQVTSKALLLVMMVAFFNVNCNAASDQFKSRLKLTFELLNDNTKKLSAKLNHRREKRYALVPNAEITFSYFSNQEEFILGTSNTDEKGVANFYLSKDYPIPVNDDNYMVFQGHFAGNDSIRSAASDLEVKNSKLQLFFTESDESKNISILLTELDPEGKEIPAVDELVTLSVARLYSILLIEEGTTNEKGLYEFSFEQEIPGDSAGNLVIVAKVEDSDIFGYVTTSKTIQWGIPVSNEVRVPRALWSDQAPLWLIAGVIIVLGGAWFNFFIAMRHVYKFANSE